MTYADPAERSALISGFRALADYLESNSDVPSPVYATVYTFPPGNSCRMMRAEIDAVAELLGSPTRETGDGAHYTVTRLFGSVEYRVVAICKHHCHHDPDWR
jgi:hypothetical protein